MRIFYIPDSSTQSIPEDEFRHFKVLRYNRGDKFIAVDGKGKAHQCELTEISKKEAKFNRIATLDQFDPPKPDLHVAIAPTKNMDRLEWFLEKSTEIGISKITPILCEHSERKHLKLDRCKKILISAMKQSKRASLPVISELTTFSEFLKTAPSNNLFVATCDELLERMDAHNLPSDLVTIIIGPEGDFSEDEVKEALYVGAKSLSLGAARLRTETAGIHVVSVINHLFTTPS